MLPARNQLIRLLSFCDLPSANPYLTLPLVDDQEERIRTKMRIFHLDDVQTRPAPGLHLRAKGGKDALFFLPSSGTGPVLFPGGGRLEPTANEEAHILPLRNAIENDNAKPAIGLEEDEGLGRGLLKLLDTLLEHCQRPW
jgi:hypothetical protein